MASTTDSTDGTDGTTDGSSGGMLDGIISFLTQPLGMGLAVGVVAAGFIAWKVI